MAKKFKITALFEGRAVNVGMIDFSNPGDPKVFVDDAKTEKGQLLLKAWNDLSQKNEVQTKRRQVETDEIAEK